MKAMSQSLKYFCSYAYLQHDLISISKIMRTLLFLFTLLIPALNGSSQEISFQNADGALSIGTQSNRTASISLIDIDKDGDLDALVANGRHWPEQNYVFYNNGKGSFKVAQPIGRFLDASYSVKSADFNNDGYMDIAVANDNNPNKLYFGSDHQHFGEAVSFGSISPSRNLELIDIDKDGDFDILLSNRKAKNEICMNDGKGNFNKIINYGSQEDQTIQTKVKDINGDGFLDIITAERQSKNHIYINDGKQNFNEKIEFGDDKEETRAIELADFDKDGYFDIITGNLGSRNIIYYGDKNLVFERTFEFKAERHTSSIKVADLDQDGILDIIEGNKGERNYVFKGSSSGQYIEIGLRDDLKDNTYNVEVGDLNNDGFIDIIESNSGDWNLIYRTRKKKE